MRVSGNRRLPSGICPTSIAVGVIGILLCTLAGPPPASAVLGGDVSSVETDRAHLQSPRRIERAEQYDIHELAHPSGTIVREYVSPEGRVFGVAWQGPRLPDLRRLMGNYFDRWVHAVSKPRAARGPLFIEQPDLVVQSSGHLRAFRGRAYVPTMLPASVRAEAIR
jgi:hypothetical protein